MSGKENVLLTNKHILLCLESIKNPELDYIKKNFCGAISTDIKDISPDKIVYLYGNIGKIYEKTKETLFEKCKRVNVIKEFSSNYQICEQYNIINIGMVPINIHNMGIYFRNFFNPTKNYFDLIKNKHNFLNLTESNKSGSAFRKGIYLSKVEEKNDGITYNLLRCSSNLDGPTDNFSDIDNEIISQANDACEDFFEEKTHLNHVLAQIYLNSDQGKAKIKAHSDKTKDMPKNGLICFCTFYADLDNKQKSTEDMFDYCYKKTSVLTCLEFKLKKCIEVESLVKTFSITLYPNSMFVIPLSTNRLYTHEIKPSTLRFDMIPIRMGYVIRCSDLYAVFKDGHTYIKEDDKLVKLESTTNDDIKNLRNNYYEENTTVKEKETIYGKVHFSMNEGDYLKPNC